MPLENALGLPHAPLVHEVNGLRQLNDWVMGKLVNDLFPKLLMIDPEVAKVPASMQEDHPRTQSLGKTSRGVSGQVTGVDNRVTVPAEPVALAEPNRAVPDVGMVGKIEQGAR